MTLHFNATVLESTILTSLVTDFALGGNMLGADDPSMDYSMLSGGTAYFMRAIGGTLDGQLSEVTAWDDVGLTITIADGDTWAADLTWSGDFDIVKIAGADLLVINDGSTDIFTTTDQNVIANGSFNVGTVSADTTYTATASISGAGSTMASASVDADGTGATYEEVVLADGPLVSQHRR